MGEREWEYNDSPIRWFPFAELRRLETDNQTVITLSRTDWADGAKLTTTWTRPAICR